VPDIILIIGIGIIDVVATYVVGKHLQNTAGQEIARGVDEIIQNAPTIIAKAMNGETSDAGTE
jgi:hypothetical protein